MNKILKSMAMLAWCGGLSHAGYSSNSLSSPIDSEGFTTEQKRAIQQQTAMAKLSAPEQPIDEKQLSSSTVIPGEKIQGNISGTTAGKVKQVFKNSDATSLVKQGNIDNSTINGDIEQDFN